MYDMPITMSTAEEPLVTNHANNTLYLLIGLWIDSDRPSKVSCSADGLVQGFTRAVSQVRDCCNKFAYPCMQRGGALMYNLF